jgi:phosphatidate cytidylyltransferase
VKPLHHDDDAAAGSVAAGASGHSNLVLRVVSAAVLAPLVVGIAYAGGWLFLALCAVAAGGIYWEWTRLVADRSEPGVLLPGLAALLAAALLLGWNRPDAAVIAILAASPLIAGIAAASSGHKTSALFWSAAGVLYAGAALLGPALLRRDAAFGFQAIVFLAGTVWATDIFAYFVGRAIGGPLLWPRISPKKTWSGAIGGLAGGVVAGILVAYASGLSKVGVIGVIALLLSIAAETGDLLESAAKRHFGAKDSSQLIPGHGGLMDRLDGFLVAALVALVIGILRHGTDAPGQGLLVW